MCEYDSNLLKNTRLLTKPWRARLVILKKNEWVDIDLVGILRFFSGKNEEISYLAIYKDEFYQSNLEKQCESEVRKPKLDEKTLRKLHQGFKMKEGECLLYSQIDKRNNYSLISGFLAILLRFLCLFVYSGLLWFFSCVFQVFFMYFSSVFHVFFMCFSKCF